jgi:hypothetical protein
MTSMELRQAFAGLLTLSMFIMLGNMIKKDHFDYAVEDVSHSLPSPMIISLITFFFKFFIMYDELSLFPSKLYVIL